MQIFQVETTEWKNDTHMVETVLVTAEYHEANERAISSINDNNNVWVYEWTDGQKEIIHNYSK